MVNYQPHRLDGIFSALSDPTRRAVLARLSEASELSVSTLAEPFAMSLPAVLKHLDVLEGAGLILRHKAGRTVSCRLNAAPMQEAQRWLAHYERFWSSRLDALERYLVEEANQDAKETTKPGATPGQAPDATSSSTSNAKSNSTPNTETIPCPSPPKPPSPAKRPASRSRAGFRRRRSAASAPGPTRKP
jgi:DNA-binding transcriptional ArsR family regulator